MNYPVDVKLTKEEANALESFIFEQAAIGLNEIREDAISEKERGDDEFCHDIICQQADVFYIMGEIEKNKKYSKDSFDLGSYGEEVVKHIHYFLEYDILEAIHKDECWDNPEYTANLFSIYAKTRPKREE